MFEITEFVQPAELRERLLQERAELAKQTTCTHQFAAYENLAEVGYLSFDDRSDIKTGVLYEVFVLLQFRHRGAGSKLVTFAEDFARSIGCTRVRLTVNAFDLSVGHNWLESWYAKRGYLIAQDGSQEYEKYLQAVEQAARESGAPEAE
ncbi:Acetyltransferase (GNAT) domain-containing protein [Nitrosospira briensis]|uniref:Acetyltransferase (GNAT) domain-containing protein n=2 Tax=Nitrosospira briensis TaxID=35799 RepID=A0A1I5BHT3_9PROT|nr:Acetyltransferase (GNAT) domain-containing protein [Nitrosospira briensis]